MSEQGAAANGPSGGAATAFRQLVAVFGNTVTVENLIVHGVAWLVASILLDAATAWTAMSILGSSMEGNALMRALFEQQNLPAFAAAVRQQYFWIGMAAWGLAFWRLAALAKRLKPGPLRTQVLISCYTLGAVPVWGLALTRFYVGTLTNIMALLFSYGDAAVAAGMLVAFLAFVNGMFLDMVRILLQSVRQAQGAQCAPSVSAPIPT